MKKKEQTSIKEQKVRPPVVVVMGHIDHGKTTFLDYIRKANVAGGESGGITQHVGAHEMEHSGRRITFLDTPGHEAFSRMRMRGAHVADIAVLIVAADDGVKPQTLEALKAIKESGIPFVVGINKIDKPEATPDKVKGELAEHDVLVEGWGGNIPVALVSAKTGEGISDLLDVILLVADLEELTGDASLPARGVVIESHMDQRRGVTVTLLIKDGTLRRGDYVRVGSCLAGVKVMEDANGVTQAEATFSSPMRILGFNAVPAVGQEFNTYANKKEAEAVNVKKDISEPISLEENDVPEEQQTVQVPILIKADVTGSGEAIEQKIEELSKNNSSVTLLVLRSALGDISDDDVKAVSAQEGAILLGFKVKVTSSALALAERFSVTIKTFDIIYELLDWLREAVEDRIPPAVERMEGGKLTVLKVFNREKNKQVFGGRVISGSIQKKSAFDIVRREQTIGGGTILNLQQNKINVDDVKEGLACGLAAEANAEIKEGDVIVTYAEHITTVTLAT